MKGIKDIIIKGSIFAVLTAVFCMGGAGRGIETVMAADEDNSTIGYFTPSVDGNKVTPQKYNDGFSEGYETIKFAGKDWYVIGYDGTGVAAQEDMITLLSVNDEADTVFGSNNSYAGSNVADYLADRYNAFSEDVKAAIVPRTLTSGSDEIAGDDITAGLWALSKSEAEKLPQDVLRIQGATSWWLRTPDSECVYAVDISGSIKSRVNVNGNSSISVRSALWVRADSVVYNVKETSNGFLKNYSYSLTPGPAMVEDTVYATIQAALDAADGGKTVKLLKDVQTTSPLTVSKTLTLDLNGHTIDRGLSGETGDGNSSGSVIKIGSNGNLTLSDNSIDQTGLITGGYADNGGGVRVESGGIFTMTGGTISGNKTYYPESWGGGVFVSVSTFKMTGGKICGNIASGGNTYGGGVYVYKSSFTMTGGEICGNSSEKSGLSGDNNYGGGLYLEDNYSGKNCSMTGGRICNNTAGSAGGGVYTKACEFTMGNDAVITGNSSMADGGGLYAEDTEFTMTGGEISHNSAVSRGGGIYNGWNFNISGGKITLNTAGTGGGIFSGDTSDSNTINITGGEITYNKAEQNAGGIYMYSPSSYPFILSGVSEINGNAEGGEIVNGTLKGGTPSNVCVMDGNIIYISGAMENSTPIGVTLKNGSGTSTTGVFAEAKTDYNSGALTADDVAHFKSDIESYEPILNANGEAELVQKVKAPAFSPAGGIYTSAQNVTISSETSGADIYYTIDGSTPTKDSGKKYTGPISVEKTMTIKAIAVKTDMADSDVSSATYTINSVPPATTYAVTVENGDGDGNYVAGATVTIKADAPTAGQVFDRWTTGDGVTFASAASETTTFTMPAKAVTVKATYRNVNTVAAPGFTPDGGNYTSEQSVTISCSTEGAVIYYTVDGTDPTKASAKYSEPIPVKEDMTIKAFAVKDGMTDSAVSVAAYTIGSETPVITKYLVTVNNGSGDGEYEENETVTIKADDPAEGKVFDKWTTEDGMEFADAASTETTFTMPAHAVTVTATYKDKEADKPDPDDPGQDDPKPVNPDPANPDSGKVPDKVPVTDPSSSYAAPEDNFAPVAPGSSEGTGGNIKKLELDFSNVKASGVDPGSLKMTAIKGSKFTTKAKVKDKNSVHTDGGVKAKFNKKDSTVTITCKNSGKATFDMEDGDSYTVAFTVEKPKPNKSEGKLTAGSAPVTKTVKDLFGTSITGGKLEVIKEKVSGRVTPSGNGITINPAEKNTIKIQYQYLNKKYKMSIKVK